jgi:hypothetical protein
MPEHIFHIERLTSVTIRDYQADVLRERATEAWLPMATVTTDSSIWRVFDEWFDTVPEAEKQGGQYRVVEMSTTEHGFGTLSGHVVKPSWSVESHWEPRPEEDGEEADVAQVA